jgi:hypothetical protein
MRPPLSDIEKPRAGLVDRSVVRNADIDHGVWLWKLGYRETE